MAKRISENEVKVLYPGADLLPANLIACHGGGGRGIALVDVGGY